jgi:hypothetical protein
MLEENQINPSPTPHQDDFQIAFSRLPDYTQTWMSSLEAAQINAKIAQKYNLPKEKIFLLASLIGSVFFKEILLEKLPEAIQQGLSVDFTLARQISIDEGIFMFLPVREYLKGIENAILSWGGQVPTTLPPKPSIYNTASAGLSSSALPAEQKVEQKSAPPVQKSLREIAKENKEIVNQLLTDSSLRFAEFDQPIRGTIKNWLSDYVRHEGTGKHNEMVRSDYLFKSDNAKSLPPEEKILVAKILKSYDENSSLTYDEEKKIIILKQPTPINTVPQEKNIPSANFSANTPASAYREAIEEKDLSGPLGKLPPKPVPRLSGNIVDLKDLT